MLWYTIKLWIGKKAGWGGRMVAILWLSQEANANSSNVKNELFVTGCIAGRSKYISMNVLYVEQDCYLVVLALK